MMRPFIASSSSQVLRGGASESEVVMAAGHPAVLVEPARRHAERVARVVVGGASHHAAGEAAGLLAAVVRPVRVGSVLARRPLAHVAQYVLHAVRAGAGGAPVHPLRGIVRSSKDRALGARRRVTPRVAALVPTARGLLPLSLRRQPPAAPEAVVAGAEPAHFDRRVIFKAGIGRVGARRPSTRSVDPYVDVVPVEVVLALGARGAPGVEKGRELPVGNHPAVEVSW